MYGMFFVPRRPRRWRPEEAITRTGNWLHSRPSWCRLRGGETRHTAAKASRLGGLPRNRDRHGLGGTRPWPWHAEQRHAGVTFTRHGLDLGIGSPTDLLTRSSRMHPVIQAAPASTSARSASGKNSEPGQSAQSGHSSLPRSTTPGRAPECNVGIPGVDEAIDPPATPRSGRLLVRNVRHQYHQ